jgi:hypothetical protein
MVHGPSGVAARVAVHIKADTAYLDASCDRAVNTEKPPVGRSVLITPVEALSAGAHGGVDVPYQHIVQVQDGETSLGTSGPPGQVMRESQTGPLEPTFGFQRVKVLQGVSPTARIQQQLSMVYIAFGLPSFSKQRIVITITFFFFFIIFIVAAGRI